MDLVRHILSLHSHTAVIMVTGLDSPVLANAALEMGAFGYVIKPFESNEVLISVANSMRRRKLEIENGMHRENLEEMVRTRTIALQQAVSSGTGTQLVRDGLGRLSPAGKTGTSNDGRDSWFAGWTGDHLAVIWVGNDQNKETGLYGATGAMRVWSAIFSRLPTAPLEVGNKGIDWQWTIASNTTDADCAGARRFAFVAGFAPPYAPCPAPEPVAEEGGGWREWFGFGKKDEEPPREETPPPQENQP